VNDIARCDGLLWSPFTKTDDLGETSTRRAYFTDCPLRKTCERFHAHVRDIATANTGPVCHVDSPQVGTACGHLIEAKTVTKN